MKLSRKIIDSVKGSGSAKPVKPKPRHRCPFYGFAYFGHIFMDSKGNQCAAKANSHSPCRMEMSGFRPDWNNCRFNCSENSKTVSMILERCKIGPDEFWPRGAQSWPGIPFQTWWDYVMSEDCPRPE